MATTKKTAARTATTRKATAKKAATKAATGRKATAKRAAAKATPKTAPKSTVDAFVEDVNEFVDEASDRVEDAFETAVRFARDAAYTYVGAGFVIQDRVAHRKFELVDYRTFLDEAKAKGETQFADIQARIEPIAAKFTQAVEPIVERIEETMPKQVKDVVDANRERMRELLAR